MGTSRDLCRLEEKYLFLQGLQTVTQRSNRPGMFIVKINVVPRQQTAAHSPQCVDENRSAGAGCIVVFVLSSFFLGESHEVHHACAKICTDARSPTIVVLYGGNVVSTPNKMMQHGYDGLPCELRDTSRCVVHRLAS
jgi:hypothetical protein